MTKVRTQLDVAFIAMTRPTLSMPTLMKSKAISALPQPLQWVDIDSACVNADACRLVCCELECQAKQMQMQMLSKGSVGMSG